MAWSDLLPKILTVFRDFEVQGLPSSGAWEPKKVEIRALLAEIIAGIEAGEFDAPPTWAADLAAVEANIETIDAAVASTAADAATATGASTAAQTAATEAVDAAADAREAADSLDALANYSTPAAAFFDRLPVRMRRGRKATFDHLFRNLDYTGERAVLDTLHFLSAAETSTAITNLTSGSYVATPIGAPVFTVDLGAVGVTNGAKRIGTGLNPATAVGANWSLTSASMGVFLGGAVTDSGSGLMGESSASYISQSSGSNNLTVGLNSTGDTTFTLAQNKALGAISASRSGNDIKAYHLGAPLGTGTNTAAGSLVNAELNLLALGSGTNFGRTVVHRAAWTGGYLTDAGNRNMAAYVGNCLDDLDGETFVARVSSSFDVVNDGASNLLPGLGKLVDGRVLQTWTVRDLTYTTGDVLKGQLLAADGKTALGSAFVIAGASGEYGYSESIVFVDPDTGAVLVSAYRHDFSDGAVSTVVFRAPNPNGGALVFAAPYTVPNPYTAPCSSGAMAKFGTKIALPLYNNNGTTNQVGVAWSEDGGVTFPTFEALLNGPLQADDRYNETSLAVNPATGNLEAWIRNGDEANSDPADPGASVIGYYTMELEEYGGEWSEPVRQLFTVFPGRPDVSYAPNGNCLLIVRGRNDQDADEFQSVGWAVRRDGGWSDPKWFWVTGTKSYGGYCYSQTIYDTSLGVSADEPGRWVSLISFGGFTVAARLIRVQFEHGV